MNEREMLGRLARMEVALYQIAKTPLPKAYYDGELEAAAMGMRAVAEEALLAVGGGESSIPWQPINTLPEEERVLLYFPKTEGGPQVISGVRVHRHILTGIDYSGEDWGEPTYWQRFNPPEGE